MGGNETKKITDDTGNLRLAAVPLQAILARQEKKKVEMLQ